MSNLPELSLEQRNALEERLLSRRRSPTSSQICGAVPLTAAQETIWIAEQLAPGRPLYNIPLAFRLSGTLRPELLQQSWRLLVRRHQALRARLKISDGHPIQEAASDGPDLTLEEIAGRDWEALANEEAQKPFDLTNGWLARARLIQISSQDWGLLITLHHLVADNHSLGILLRELSAGYSALLRGEKPALSETPPQFLDLATQRRSGENPEAAGFWRQWTTLAPETRTPRSKAAGGDWRAISIPAEVAASLKELARREQTTLYMTLLAAFAALLHRQTGRETVTVGAPVSQRDFARAEEVIGLFVHTVPVGLTFEGDPTFLEILRRLKTEAVACFRHARFLPAGAPAFDTVFQLIDDAGARFHLPDTTITETPVRTRTAKFDLTVSLAEKAGALRGNVEFASSAFDASSAGRLLERYLTLLRNLIAAPDRPISEVSILSEEEQRLVVTEWNRTETKYPREATIQDLFEEQVKLRPQATALLFENERITYEELDRRANGVAAFLRQHGVARGDFVGICMERSPRLIAGLIGILKAGAAYAPMDVDYPPERLEYMRRDAGAKTVLTDASAVWAAQPASFAPQGRGAATDNAYIIYTSGSTGQPKGVVVPHRAVARLVKETNYAAFGHDEVFLQFAPATFDASTFEIWGALLNGATLAIYPPRFESLSQFGAVLRQYGVTTLWLTAGLFHQMVENNLDALRCVRQLLAGGDVLSPSCVKTVLREIPSCRLINGYGPTENTTFSCCHTLPPGWDGESVPIGRAISNTRAYILDKHFRPTGIGVPGELCVAGDGLATGYLNHPGLTAEKFVPDPFSTAPGAKLYRTGDLARFLPDGPIEFLGRIDQQVKIRGFRVELGEVEEGLRAHPGVAQAAVTAVSDSTQTRHLAAYVVARLGHSLDSGALRQFLRERMPAHLVPSRFFFLPNLPLTANGKVDKRKLPADEGSAAADTLTPPRTETERALAEIWRELLGLKDLGVEQNFFELGGHSLLAMRLQSRIFKALAANIPLRDIFENPTLAALAARLAASSKTTANPPALIPRRPRREAAVA